MNNLPLVMPAPQPANQNKIKHSFVGSVLANRCPHCREGKLFVKENAYDFKNNLKMHDNCPVCKQPTEIEVGFYYGTSYISYLLTVALSGVTFILWWIFVGLSVNDDRILYWLGINAALIIIIQPLPMRLSRTLWLTFFVKYNPAWKDYE